MSEDPELRAFDQKLHQRRKTLAVLGLILVGGVLAWRFAVMFGYEVPAARPHTTVHG